VSQRDQIRRADTIRTDLLAVNVQTAQLERRAALRRFAHHQQVSIRRPDRNGDHGMLGAVIQDGQRERIGEPARHSDIPLAQ
jgi:hypothetical protein